jgi:hypothetical protein
MKTSKFREIACAIILDVDGRFLVQQRDDIAGILHPGKIKHYSGDIVKAARLFWNVPFEKFRRKLANSSRQSDSNI